MNSAKPNEMNLHSTTQMVYFTENKISSDELKLLELDNNLLNTIQEGQNLYFKGQNDDNPVICSDKLTYDVTIGETSNSLLLVKNINFFNDLKDRDKGTIQQFKVYSVFNEYLLGNPSKSHIKSLLDVLNKSIYTGPENEYKIEECNTYSYEELNDIVQMCTIDLKDNLDKMPIAIINGKIRLLDFSYHFRSLSLMLNLIEENSWNFDEIDSEETINSIRSIVPEEILVSLIEKYTEPSKIVDGLQLYKYKEDDVCKFFAQVLLSDVGKISLYDFLEMWTESVPKGMIPKEELLSGISIIDDAKSKTPFIREFNSLSLPDNIHDRFNALFKAKEKWMVSEISPYIVCLTTKKVDTNSLLAKYARVSTVNGIKYYSAKHS